MTRDDELLASYVAGELGDDSAEIRELRARRPEALAAAADLSTVARELDAGGALERRLIVAARAQASASDRERVASAFERSSRAPSSRFGVSRWLVAAALVLSAAGAALYFQPRAPGEREVQVLNRDRDAQIVLRAPQAPLTAGVALEWNAPALAASERFSLEFRALDAGGSPGKLLRRLRCTSASWTPSTADLSDWPEQVSLVIARVELESGGRELALSQPFSLRVAR